MVLTSVAPRKLTSINTGNVLQRTLPLIWTDNMPEPIDELTVLLAGLVKLLIKKGVLEAQEIQAVVTKAVVSAIERGAKPGFEIAAVDLLEEIEALKTVSDGASKNLSSELRRIHKDQNAQPRAYNHHRKFKVWG